MTALSQLAAYATQAAESGAVSALSGGVKIARGMGSLRRGNVRRAGVRLLVGTALVGLAAMRWRSTRSADLGADDANPGTSATVDQTDVVGTGTDLDTETRSDRSDQRGSAGDPADVVETAVDVSDVDERAELDSDADAAVDQRDVVETGVGNVEDADSDADENRENRRDAETGTGTE